MFKTVVNLTQQAASAEIENVLETYPFHPYQKAFAIPDLRQELIAYVLSNTPCVYSAVDDAQKNKHNYKVPHNYLEQQVNLQNVIHQGIYIIWQERSECIAHHLPETTQLGLEPSHWFG